MADDICVEADSGGHTDRGVAATLLPAIQRQRDAAMAAHAYRKSIRVGCAGGIGTPEAAAAAFVLGADFILTGSINQCTVEAGTSDLVKDLLQEMQVQDTDYAPAGDMFEIGARVQVLKRGLFFPVRANKLYELYRSVDSIEQIDPGTARMIQEKYFQRSLAEVYGTADAVSATLPPGSDRRTRSAQWPWHRADRRTRCPGGIPRTHPAIVSESLHQSPSAPRFL